MDGVSYVKNTVVIGQVQPIKKRTKKQSIAGRIGGQKERGTVGQMDRQTYEERWAD